ncbi:MAG: OmpA family protein [Microscillaceae bacterium]|nr:OmpA family protein [Microscillaceae bacterium]
MISADGLTLYYNRKDHPQNTVNANRSDIWYSTQNKEGIWGPAQNIGRPLNNEGHNFVISVSPDGNTLLLGNLYKSDGSTAGTGISISFRNQNGWTLPQEVKVGDFYNDNPYNEYCLAPNNKVLLLCLQRKDTYGQKDIYVSFLQENGSWSAPQNIGLPVNSIGNEVGPFLAADGTTMYYSTDGHKGYGRNDIFVTRRLDDSWLRWSEPENLGPAINTPNWDAYYTVPAQGDYAYMVSSQNSLGAEDIFRLKLPESARPQTVVLIKGRVLHSKTKAPLEAQVVYELLKNGAEVGLARANPVDGTYQIALPAGEIYGFLGKAEGFYPVSESIDTQPYQQYTVLERDLYLTPIEKNEVIRLNNLFFDFAKFSLRDQSFPELNRLVAFLNNNPEVRIEIGGHTDNVGTEANNLSLSKNRAEAVQQYLLKRGIAPERVLAKGYGEAKPIADNNTEAGRQQNRRVEFKIL